MRILFYPAFLPAFGGDSKGLGLHAVLETSLKSSDVGKAEFWYDGLFISTMKESKILSEQQLLKEIFLQQQ